MNNNKNINDSTTIITTNDNGKIKISTFKELVEANNINTSTVRKRISNGMTLEEAITTPVNYNKIKVIDPRTNKEVFLYELAKDIGMKVDTLHNRIVDEGWSVEDAISMPISDRTKKKEITSDLGDTYSYNTWDIILGFGRGNVSHKIKRGKTEKEAISTGLRNAIYFIDPKTNKPIPQDKVGENDLIN